jgi:sensor histidine kinase YesM
MKIKFATYWKYQLMGWGLFVLFLLFLNLAEKNLYNTSLKTVYFVPLLAACLGLFVSHCMREVIRRLKIMQKKYVVQVSFLLASTLFFGSLLTVMIVFGVTMFRLDYYNSKEEAQKTTFIFKLLSAFPSILLVMLIWNLFYYMVHYVQKIRKQGQEKLVYEKELLDLEAKALRAQMNPHFIFNCMNSIKSLIQKNENETASAYLTTFSKLIRTLFQNSDRREVSLYEELETCKLYSQLEKMRFDNKFTFDFDIENTIDFKDIRVPAFVIQPFIENAIWHGLVPKETVGKVAVSVKIKNAVVECIIDDDGIGRELSWQYKARNQTTHQSKGIGLTRSRLELDKLLNNREDTIQIIDKTDRDGKPAGTTVVLTFKEPGI